ncbi:NAC domain-containing protein 2-like [Solanum lycopersicum]|uniref:NAC domain-containing protein n=1 Tax=Solanum lycopersicum TaxID=4081 RepID=K4C832_SOLLC|nr:NAC domain-containing protein 55-like [Solanum lycopersicum]
MSGEEEWKQQIPPGFRFIPTDEEILQYYLFRYVTGNYILPGIIPLVDLYECDPDYLPGVNMDGEYTYFFTKRDRKYVNGTKNTSRVTRDGRGYWKSTNKKSIVVAQDGSKLGKKTTLKYYFKNPEGDDIPAQWIMHEYVISCKIVKPSIEDEYYEDIAACRIYKKKPEVKEETLTDPNLLMSDHNNNGEPQLSVKRKFIASDPPHDTTMSSNYLCDSQAALILDGMRTTYEVGQTSNTKSIPIEINHTSSTNLTPFEIDQMSYTKSTLFEIGQTSNTNSTPLQGNIVPMGKGVFVDPTDQTSTNVYQNQSNEGKIEGTNFDLDLDGLHNILHDSSPPDESFEEYWQSLQI